MSIEYRKATSDRMKKNKLVVSKLTSKMGFDENMGKADWPKIRRILNFSYQLVPKEKGIKFSKIETETAKMFLSESENSSKENIILYIHGGGFVSGAAEASKGYTYSLAKCSNNPVYAVEYALAPEDPFPKGFNDCVNAFDELSTMYPDAKITLVGESAGANLCLAVALKRKETGKIACVIVHSPIVDFTGSMDRKGYMIDDFIIKKGCMGPLKEMYVVNNDVADPYISVILGDYKDFPPVFITCDINETLYADAKALYKKCEEEHIKVRMIEMEGAFHAFAAIGISTPEAKDVLNDNVSFIKECLL